MIDSSAAAAAAVKPDPAPTLQRVLVALDESPSAAGALQLAIELSRHYGSELALCTSVDHAAAAAAAISPDGVIGDVQLILAQYDTAAKKLLVDASTEAVTAGARVSTQLLDGRPAPALVEYAKTAACDAIVMGTHGKNGLERLFLGSTAEGVLRVTAVPVIVVREPRDGDAPAAPVDFFERILVALDDSEPSDAALAFALQLAAAKHSRLLCCTVIETSDLLDKAAFYGYDPTSLLTSLRQAAANLIASKTRAAIELGITVESVIVESSAPLGVLEAAKDHAADLIVIGTHGRRGLRRLFMGSVAESTVRHATVAVAVVRAHPDHAGD